MRLSIVQRKVLVPNDFPDPDTLEQRLLAFGRRPQLGQPTVPVMRLRTAAAGPGKHVRRPSR